MLGWGTDFLYRKSLLDLDKEESRVECLEFKETVFGLYLLLVGNLRSISRVVVEYCVENIIIVFARFLKEFDKFIILGYFLKIISKINIEELVIKFI